MLQSKITNFAKDAGLNGVNTGKIIHKTIRNQDPAEKQKKLKNNTIGT